MDDIICLFNGESDADHFFVFLNQRHPKIKFTIEKQIKNQLSFLDLLITSNSLTSVYWKNHFIGLYINHLRFTPFSYKTGLVKTLHRVFVISGDWSIFHLELSKTKELPEKNLYPSSFIYQQIKQYLHAQFSDIKHKEPGNSTYVFIIQISLYWKFVDRNKQNIIKHCKYYCKSWWNNSRLSSEGQRALTNWPKVYCFQTYWHQ